MNRSPWAMQAVALLITAAASVGICATAAAEMYIGAGVGKSAVEIDAFDEDDSSSKLIVGYIFDLPAVDFSVEANYVDFGSPRHEPSGTELDLTGIDAFAVAGVDFGLVGLFAKAGVLAWDGDAVAPGFSMSDDGTDSAYGIGVRFNIRSLVVRAEYEKFDVDSTDDLDMVSASLLWRF
jgi:outer membrane immunogenic protein